MTGYYPVGKEIQVGYCFSDNSDIFDKFELFLKVGGRLILEVNGDDQDDNSESNDDSDGNNGLLVALLPLNDHTLTFAFIRKKHLLLLIKVFPIVVLMNFFMFLLLDDAQVNLGGLNVHKTWPFPFDFFPLFLQKRVAFIGKLVHIPKLYLCIECKDLLLDFV